MKNGQGLCRGDKVRVQVFWKSDARNKVFVLSVPEDLVEDLPAFDPWTRCFTCGEADHDDKICPYSAWQRRQQESVWTKHKFCMYFINGGTCPYKDNCKFAHSQEEIGQPIIKQ